MATNDIDLTLFFRKKHTPPPSVLLVAAPNEKMPKDDQPRTSPTGELRSRQQKPRQATPHTTSVNVTHLDIHDTSSSYAWQRHSDKLAQIIQAPDVAYRNTYLDEPKKDKSPVDYRSTSPSPRSQQSQPPLPRLKTASVSSQNTSNSLKKAPYPQYRTIYDYIRQSIRQIERQRNFKQNFTSRVKRPQNDDDVLRRVLGDKRTSAASKTSSLLKPDLRNPESLVNYMNHSREQIRSLHTTTTLSQTVQINPKYSRQRANLSQNQNDSLEKQQLMMMTATVGNS
jgi:hypothetical protein